VSHTSVDTTFSDFQLSPSSLSTPVFHLPHVTSANSLAGAVAYASDVVANDNDEPVWEESSRNMSVESVDTKKIGAEKRVDWPVASANRESHELTPTDLDIGSSVRFFI